MASFVDRITRALHRALHKRPKLERWHSAELARVLDQRPAALPPSSNDLTHSSIFTHPQLDSLFFTLLPPELRRRIYTYVLGDNIIYLTHVSRRVVHQHYPLPSSASDEDDHEHETIASPAAPEIRWLSSQDRIPQSAQFHTLALSLLQTCHAVYSEGIPVLYGSNVFSLSSPLPLLYLHDRLLPQSHFVLIRHLRLHWTYFADPGGMHGCIYEPYDFDTWAGFWGMVAGMELASLGVEIEVWGGEEDVTEEARWVREMMQVRGVREVEVRIYWRMLWNRIRQPDLEKAVRRNWGSTVEE